MKGIPTLPSLSSESLLPHLIPTIRPSTLCLLLVLLSLSNRQRRQNPPLPPFPQFPTIPPPMMTPQTNYSLRNWLSTQFRSRRTGLAALTTRAWWKTLTLHLQASFTMSLKATIFTLSTSQIPSMESGTKKAAPRLPGTYSITPTIHMSLALKAKATPNTPSQSTSVDKPVTTPP